MNPICYQAMCSTRKRRQLCIAAKMPRLLLPSLPHHVSVRFTTCVLLLLLLIQVPIELHCRECPPPYCYYTLPPSLLHCEHRTLLHLSKKNGTKINPPFAAAHLRGALRTSGVLEVFLEIKTTTTKRKKKKENSEKKVTDTKLEPYSHRCCPRPLDYFVSYCM